jgi:hypothetical protein
MVILVPLRLMLEIDTPSGRFRNGCTMPTNRMAATVAADPRGMALRRKRTILVWRAASR